MDEYLTTLDDEIAELERAAAALPNTKQGRLQRVALDRQIEALVRKVQWATVGAAKPGQVL